MNSDLLSSDNGRAGAPQKSAQERPMPERFSQSPWGQPQWTHQQTLMHKASSFTMPPCRCSKRSALISHDDARGFSSRQAVRFADSPTVKMDRELVMEEIAKAPAHRHDPPQYRRSSCSAILRRFVGSRARRMSPIRPWPSRR